MPQIREAIDRMSTAEKLVTMDYLWSAISRSATDLPPAWHERELHATEDRVAAGVERPIPWETAKAILRR